MIIVVPQRHVGIKWVRVPMGEWMRSVGTAMTTGPSHTSFQFP